MTLIGPDIVMFCSCCDALYLQYTACAQSVALCCFSNTDLGILLMTSNFVVKVNYYYYYYYYYYHHHHHRHRHRISHFSPLAVKHSPILGCSNQQDYARWSYL